MDFKLVVLIRIKKKKKINITVFFNNYLIFGHGIHDNSVHVPTNRFSENKYLKKREIVSRNRNAYVTRVPKRKIANTAL